ncbi:MAG: cell division protein FtsA [bacterium]|nr:cell division protein FtsA [bacterium]
MAIMPLFTGSHKETFHLGIAIGTGSVNAILYSIGKEAKPRIQKTVMRPHSVMPQPDFKVLEQFVKHELGEVKKSFADMLKGVRIEGVHVLLSSPWYFSQTRIVHIRRDEPFMAEPAFLKESIHEEKDRFIQDARKQFSFPAEEYAIIEMSFMKILMNGYELNDFLGKKAHEVSLDMYMSLSLKQFIDHLTHVLETHFSPADILWYTSPFIFFRTLKQFWKENHGASEFDIDSGVLAVEVGGEITDVTIIRKGIIEETFSFGKGLHFIIRRLASSLHVAPKDAIAFFDAWTQDKVATDKKQKIASVVKAGLQEWQTLLARVLADASSRALLPRRIAFLGEGARYDGFAKAFSSPPFMEYVLQNKPFEVTLLTPAFFRSAFNGPASSFIGGEETALLYMLALPVEFNRLD